MQRITGGRFPGVSLALYSGGILLYGRAELAAGRVRDFGPCSALDIQGVERRRQGADRGHGNSFAGSGGRIIGDGKCPFCGVVVIGAADLGAQQEHDFSR